MAKGRAIDPLRVLRRYWKGIILWGVIGSILGTGAYFLFSRIYPLYTGEVMFEVRPGLGEATEIGTTESINDKMVERVQATQTYLIVHRSILSEALSDRTIRETTWIQQFIDPVMLRALPIRTEKEFTKCSGNQSSLLCCSQP